MKKLLIPTISVLFLAACGAANAPADAPVEVNSDTVLDDNLFQEATSSKNLAKCDEILDSGKKEECKMVVNSFLITADAVAKLDGSLCKEITDGRYKENCENLVNDTIADKGEYEKKLEDAKKLEEEVLAIESKAIQNGDADICNDITDSNQKYSCRYNVIANIAISEENPSLCDEIGESERIAKCKESTDVSND